MIQIIKHNSSPLASCPYCNAQVRHDRIEKHILKVHQSKNNKRGIRKQCFLSKVQSEKAIFYNQLNFYSKQISDWLDKHLTNCYSITEAEVLTIMFVIEHFKYKKSELSKFIDKWSEEDYIQESKKLRKLFDDIKSDLFKNKEDFESQIDSEYGISWQDFNSYETRFGKKYIGYLRREYQNSRFGSYPLHDDYSEESDPEGFTNLDY